MSPSVDTRTMGPASSAGLRDYRPLALLAALIILSVVLLAPRLGLPAKVPPLTIDNPTAYTVFIEASSPTDSGWAPIAIVPAHNTHIETELIDEGPVWNLRFTSQGVVVGGYQVDRAALAAHHWSYTVPTDVAARLQRGGTPPNP